MTEAKSDELYLQLYRDLPFDALYRPLLADVLTRLPQVKGCVLIHCSAGKDRTGMTVALVQHALGVSQADIMDDFMASNTSPGLIAMAEPNARRMSERYGKPIPVALMRRLLQVQPSFLEAFFDEIERRCGSVAAYLDQAGLDEDRRATLQARLLTS